MITAPLKYHGGKQPIAKWLHSLAPPSAILDSEHGYTHRNIVFGGGLGEFWNWQPVDGISEAVNDTNSALINFYAVLRSPEMYEVFRRYVEFMPFCDSVFEAAKDGFSDRMLNDGVIAAVEFFVHFRQSRQGLGKCYATPTRRTRRGMNENVSAYLSAVEGLQEVHERLIRVEIRNLPFARFIEQYDHKLALFYCDPPYLHETRSTTGEYGQHEMTPEQHYALLAQLARIKGRFMLSGYRSEMYDAHAQVCSWQRHELETANKASSSKVKEKRVECVWTNY